MVFQLEFGEGDRLIFAEETVTLEMTSVEFTYARVPADVLEQLQMWMQSRESVHEGFVFEIPALMVDIDSYEPATACHAVSLALLSEDSEYVLLAFDEDAPHDAYLEEGVATIPAAGPQPAPKRVAALPPCAMGLVHLVPQGQEPATSAQMSHLQEQTDDLEQRVEALEGGGTGSASWKHFELNLSDKTTFGGLFAYDEDLDAFVLAEPTIMVVSYKSRNVSANVFHQVVALPELYGCTGTADWIFSLSVPAPTAPGGTVGFTLMSLQLDFFSATFPQTKLWALHCGEAASSPTMGTKVGGWSYMYYSDGVLHAQDNVTMNYDSFDITLDFYRKETSSVDNQDDDEPAQAQPTS